VDGTLCETCDLSFYESTDFFSSISADPSAFIKNVVDTDLMTALSQAQNRCCDAGVQLGDAELIQACLTDDGDSEMQLELTDMNECLQREVQPMRYLQQGVAIPGYSTFNQVIDAQIVSDDVCCNKGCEGDQFLVLLPACVSREDQLVSSSNSISGPTSCSLTEVFDAIYSDSNGPACTLEATATYDTSYGDPKVSIK
jgi:hypothetical protein